MAVVRSDSDLRVEEKLAECFRFIGWFNQKFVREGQAAPPFYEGLLSDATCAAWNAPALSVKMLALYLHHDESPFAAEFASHLLCDAVRQVIADHCVLWGWDTTSPHNWHLVVEMVFENFGNAIAEVFQEMCELDFPCMIFLTRGKGGIDLVEFVPGSPRKFNTVMSLYHAADVFAAKLRPSLAHQENRKKQKSLFCGGGWTKVTEAMAIKANMATYRFMNCLSEVPDTREESEKAPGSRTDHSQDIDLGKILSVREMNLGRTTGPETSRESNSILTEDKPNRKERMKIVGELMLEDLSLRRTCTPD